MPLKFELAFLFFFRLQANLFLHGLRLQFRRCLLALLDELVILDLRVTHTGKVCHLLGLFDETQQFLDRLDQAGPTLHRLSVLKHVSQVRRWLQIKSWLGEFP